MRPTPTTILVLMLASMAQSQPLPPTPAIANQNNKSNSTSKQTETSNHQTIADQLSTAIDKLTSEVASWKQHQSSAPNKNEPPADWWGRGSTILEALSTLVIAILAYCQWRTLKEHKKAFESMAGHLESGLVQTTIAANAAKGSADAAKQSFVLSHRPKLSIRFMNPTEKYADAIPISGSCQVFNTGETKAVLDRQWFEIVIGKHLPAVAPYQGKHGKRFVDETLVPGNPVEIIFPTDEPRAINTEEYIALANHRDFVQARSGERPTHAEDLFVVGWISYFDETKTSRTVGFCQRYNFWTERFERVADFDYEYGDRG